MRDISIRNLDRKVFNKIPDVCIKSWEDGDEEEASGIRNLAGVVNVVIKDVFDIVFSEDNDLVITVFFQYNPSVVIKVPCDTFSSVVIH